MKSLFMTLMLVLLLVLLIGTSYLIYDEKSFILQSRANIEKISGDNSLAVSTPTCAKADGESITRLQVYCLNTRGLGGPNIRVSVAPTSHAQSMSIRAVQGTTDQTGKAIFDITSSTEGIFDLTIKCGDVLIQNNHRACFTSS